MQNPAQANSAGEAPDAGWCYGQRDSALFQRNKQQTPQQFRGVSVVLNV